MLSLAALLITFKVSLTTFNAEHAGDDTLCRTLMAVGIVWEDHPQELGGKIEHTLMDDMSSLSWPEAPTGALPPLAPSALKGDVWPCTTRWAMVRHCGDPSAWPCMPACRTISFSMRVTGVSASKSSSCSMLSAEIQN